MRRLIIHPTDTAQWHALVNEAQHLRSMSLDEELESYLVFLLMRFASRPEMADSVVGMEFLSSAQATGQQRQDQLRDVGDKCLLFSGLFPERAEKRLVEVDYFVDVGQSAYRSLSNTIESDLAELFEQLYQGFVPMVDVLQAMRFVPEESLHLLPAFVDKSNKH